MTSIAEHFSKSRGLLNSLEAANNWRALLMLLATGASVALVMFLAGVLGAQMGALVGGLMALIALGVGICGLQAAGLLFMDQARGLPLRGFMDAILGGVFSAFKLLGVLLLELLAVIGWLIVLAIVFLICKIPGIGPALYAIAFPVAAALTGLGLFAMIYIGNTIAAPSVWDGNGVLPTISRLWVVSRQRGLAVLVSALLLMLLAAFASVVVLQVVFLGVMTTGAVSAPIVGAGMGGLPGLGMLTPMMDGYGGFGGGGAYMAAAGFGAGLLFAIGLTIPLAIVMLGSCLIYLQAIEGLDFGAAEEKMKQRMSEAKQRMDEAKARAQQSMQRPETPTTPPVDSALACPKCNAAVTSDDVFCGSCGQKLK